MKQRTVITIVLPIIFNFIGIILSYSFLSIFGAIGALMIVAFQIMERKKRNIILYRELFWSTGVMYLIFAIFSLFFSIINIISDLSRHDLSKALICSYLFYCIIFNSTIYLFKIRKFKKSKNKFQ
jgi:hypothetical protein